MSTLRWTPEQNWEPRRLPSWQCFARTVEVQPQQESRRTSWLPEWRAIRCGRARGRGAARTQCCCRARADARAVGSGRWRSRHGSRLHRQRHRRRGRTPRTARGTRGQATAHATTRPRGPSERADWRWERAIRARRRRPAHRYWTGQNKTVYL